MLLPLLMFTINHLAQGPLLSPAWLSPPPQDPTPLPPSPPPLTMQAGSQGL
jgi:hypothetical protein